MGKNILNKELSDTTMGFIAGIFSFFITMFGAIDVEMAHYTVVKKTADYEVRRYAPAVAAQVKMADPNDKGGFRMLAKYIGVMGEPANEGHKAIAMTAPVVSDAESMKFILPGKETMATLPKPENGSVQLEQLPARTMVVQRYSWNTDMADAAKRIQKLAVLAKDENLDLNEWELMRYNPPWCIPFLKTNEIAIMVKD